MRDDIIQLREFPTDSPIYQEILTTLCEFNNLGFQGPVIQGGALRDIFIGREKKIKDFDMLAGFPASIDLTQNDDAIIRSIEEMLANSSLFSDAQKITFTSMDGVGQISRNEETGYIGCAVNIMLGNREVSLSLTNQVGQLQTLQKVIGTCSPVNTIIMDHTGDVYAHKNFAIDAQNKEFNPFFTQTERLARSFTEKVDVNFEEMNFSYRSQKMADKGYTTRGFTMPNGEVKPLF
ncbi:MAG: hypothetical protein GC136_05975 [Alphaproteobacteria bacterium]|nr:hypothetical protein [Alphaproteobacteria bacterium]